MDFGCFASTLDPVHTDLMNIIREYLLEGTQSRKNIKVELCELNVYGAHLIFVHSDIWYYAAVQVMAQPSRLTSILPGARRCLARSSFSFQRSIRVGLCTFVAAVTNGASTLARRLLVQPTTDCLSVTWHYLAMSSPTSRIFFQAFLQGRKGKCHHQVRRRGLSPNSPSERAFADISCV